MSLFFTYLVMGLAIAMPVGVITVEMTKQVLKNGFMHGWAVGLGGMTVDLLLIFALYLGFASILSIPYILTPMWLIGASFLLFIGYDSIKNAGNDISLTGKENTKSLFLSYRNGLLVAISPGNIIFWLSVFGAIITKSYDSAHPNTFLIVASGILSGILIHDIGLLSILSITRKVMNHTTIKWVSIVAGIILIGFSGYFLYEFIISIKSIF